MFESTLCWCCCGEGGASWRCGGRAWVVTTDGCGMAAVVCGYAVVMFVWATLCVHVIPFTEWSKTHFIFFTTSCGLILISHVRCMCGDSGHVPPNPDAVKEHEEERAMLQKAKDEDPDYRPSIPLRRWCKKCQNWKPRASQAHHCSLCNKCVRKMDHHCTMFSLPPPRPAAAL